jgi:hypothetical protein
MKIKNGTKGLKKYFCTLSYFTKNRNMSPTSQVIVDLADLWLQGLPSRVILTERVKGILAEEVGALW